MGADQSNRISEHFSKLKDPRKCNRRHLLIDIVTIAICGIVCNADTFEHIAEFGRAKHKWLKQFLALPHGIPSADTFERVFARIDPEDFKSCFLEWVKQISMLTNGEIVAVDGKTVRRSHDQSNGKRAIHMVSAWACANGLVLGQVKTDEKSNEITAIPELLRTLAIAGCIVTIDAMGCQKKIVETIVDKNADYVLALKGNQGSLHEDIKLFFQSLTKSDLKGAGFDFHETVEADHGRVETRRYWTTSEIDWLQGKQDWQELKTICMAERIREFADRTENETSYYIGSIASQADRFACAVRNHWGIENSLHWVLDVAFREDESRVRKDNAPENLAVLRHIALNLVKKETSLKKSIKSKRLRAGWDNDYLIKILDA